MSKTALTFSSLTKDYGRSAVLNAVSFEVAAGEFFGLVGVNGAGKTTLLKCMLDLCAADSGNIEIFGRSHRDNAARQRLSFLPERFYPPYFLTGEKFIRHALRLQSVAYDRRQAEHTLGMLDLDLAALKLPVRSYSKGMTQKLGLAACFLSGRELYVFDEPTSGLDPKARAQFKSHLRELKRQSHTLFLTSHALTDVAEICDRVAVMHAGKLCFAGTPRELCQKFGADALEQAFLRCIESSTAHDASNNSLGRAA